MRRAHFNFLRTERQRRRNVIRLLATTMLIGLTSTSYAETFAQWKESFKETALAKGISAQTLELAITPITYHPKIIELDRRQPEFTTTFDDYIKKRVSATRVELGKKQIQKHQKALQNVASHYGIPAEIITAIWGAESNYGTFPMKYNVIRSLATLAYDKRRRTYFTKELIAALKIIDNGDVEVSAFKGSWAGALGQTQFMPSNYLRLAQDFNNDGRRDIWSTPEDVFASIAHYLVKKGWRDQSSWGQVVSLPKNFQDKLPSLKNTKKQSIRALNSHTISQPIERWRALGLPVSSQLESSLEASLYVPESKKEQAFLTYPNYRAILRYNPSNYYAISIGLLADKLKKN